MDSYKEDTIVLNDFVTDKVVAYKVSYVTFYFDLKECKEDFSQYWDAYKQAIKKIKKGEKPEPNSNMDYYQRAVCIDSIYSLLKNKDKRDTVFINYEAFSKAGLRGFDIDKWIEKRACAIADSNNVLHYNIIRRKGGWYRGPLAAWSGRHYFLPGYKEFFCRGTDSIS